MELGSQATSWCHHLCQPPAHAALDRQRGYRFPSPSALSTLGWFAHWSTDSHFRLLSPSSLWVQFPPGPLTHPFLHTLPFLLRSLGWYAFPICFGTCEGPCSLVPGVCRLRGFLDWYDNASCCTKTLLPPNTFSFLLLRGVFLCSNSTLDEAPRPQSLMPATEVVITIFLTCN
jgi:hypothetical protein